MPTKPAAASTKRALAVDPMRVSDHLREESLEEIKRHVAPEDWGPGDDVLRHYLALHLPLAIEQGLYVWSAKQLVLRAGSLATATRTAIYLGLSPAEDETWSLAWAGERPRNVEPLNAADLGAWPKLDLSNEVVVAVEQVRAPALAGLPHVTKIAALGGAVEWSLRRALAARHVHRGQRGYLAPVHLTDPNGEPDLVGAIRVHSARLLVTALLERGAAYAGARAVVREPGDLPWWVRACAVGTRAG